MYILRLRLCFKSPPGDFSFQQRNVIMILANEEVIYLGWKDQFSFVSCKIIIAAVGRSYIYIFNFQWSCH